MSLPENLPHHWTTDEGQQMAVRYADLRRGELGQSGLSDFQLANAVFMAGRNDLELIVYQTAAKERIRWLSVRLAIAEAALLALANAADTVGVEHFDSDDLSDEVEAMRDATLEAREIIAKGAA